jgi:PAS domain S-box-containing protein
MHKSVNAARFNGAGKIIALLLSIFVTEFAVMEFLYPLFSRLGAVPAALVDAAIVVVVVAIPLRVFYAPVPVEAPDSGDAPVRVPLVETLIVLFMIEYLVMLMLPQLMPLTDLRSKALTDAFLTAASSSLPLWWFLSRQKGRRGSEPLMETSLRFYILLLCTIFLSDLLQELLLPLRPSNEFASGKITDAFLTTVCGAPILWLLVVRPFKRAARSERTRVSAVHAQVIDAIVTIDETGAIRSFNPAAERIFGYRATEMIGTQAALLVDQGGAGLDLLIASATSRVQQQAPPASTELVCRRQDGMPLIMGVSISEILLERKPEFLLIMRDITKRKRMEEALRDSELRFKEIFHQSEDAIIFFRRGSCEILELNAKAERTFGYSSEELQRGGVALIAGPEEIEPLCAAISGITEGNRVKREFSCRRKDQSSIMVSLRGKVMLLQDGPVTYCTLRDITERIRGEEKNREIQAKLIQANKMTSLGLLVSGVAHEINNPNNFIMANTELLKRILDDAVKVVKEYREEHPEGELYLAGIPAEELGEHSQRLVEGIVHGSRRVNDIVKNLKDFARQERRQVLREVDVNHVARSAVSLLHHELIKYTHNFKLELADPLPPVKGHAQQLGQVIINLLMNACQALPRNESGIRLRTRFDERKNLVTIAVSDEGCGMSREGSLRIMEPFFTTKLDSGGTGLGLSISESIVKEHGGRLDFRSEPGRGTTFSVTIPAARDAGAGAEPGRA